MSGSVGLHTAPQGRARVAYAPPTPAEIGHAAVLCWLDERTDEQIAATLGISRRTLARWKRRADFRAAQTAEVVWRTELDRWNHPASGQQVAAASRPTTVHTRAQRR